MLNLMVKKLLFAAFCAALAATVHAQGTVVWSENFDAAASLPAGWTQVSSATDGGWIVGTTASLGSSSFTAPVRTGYVIGTNDDKCNCNKANEMLVTPAIDLTAQSGNLTLLFDLFFYKGTYQSKTESLKVQASIDNGTTWTDLIVLPATSGWRAPYAINVSSYAGKTVKFGFVYDDGGGWLYGAVMDNIRVVIPDNILKGRVANVSAGRYIDVVPTTVSGYTKLPVDGEVIVRGSLSNPGFPPINSYDVTVKRGSETLTKSFSSLDIQIGLSHSFSFNIPVIAGSNNFSVEVSNINGIGDDDPSDNVGTLAVDGIVPQPGRKVIIEEGTGTWCGWCPRGAVMLAFTTSSYPDNTIGIAVHNSSSDPMRVLAYDQGMGTLISGYPSGLVDRETDIDPLEFERDAIVHMAEAPKILVSQNVTWDDATRIVNVTSSLNFQQEMNGDYSIAVVYTEDGVKGTATGYAQANYYANNAAGPMGGYQSLPSTVPAAQMVYDHVARALIGGFTGKAVVPTSNPAGSVMSYQSTYTVPAAYNINNMKVVTMVLDLTTGQIINAEETPIPFVSTGASDLKNDLISASLFPNPVQDEATLTLNLTEKSDVQVRIVDAFGRVVLERNYAEVNGKQYLPFRAGNLANGMYTLVATAKGQSVSKPFVITR